MSKTLPIQPEIQKLVFQLLQVEVLSLRNIQSGRNSRLWKATLKNGGNVAIKQYYQNPEDTRNRLKTEFQSFDFLWIHGIQDVPRPLAHDQEKQIALYEWIEGEPLAGQSITSREIDSAVQFLKKLDDLKNFEQAQQLSNASEACFSLSELFQNLEGRLNRLRMVRSDANLSKEMQSFLKENLDLTFQDLKKKTTDFKLSLNEKTLSPSDFGFHNAIKQQDDKIVFLDFEYFGWDDPAKTICDFLLHPAMNLDQSLKKRFVSELLKIYQNQTLSKRAQSLFPVFALKWCVILLNEFVETDLKRREFAQSGNSDSEKLLRDQLDKARKMFQNIGFKHDYFG